MIDKPTGIAAVFAGRPHQATVYPLCIVIPAGRSTGMPGRAAQPLRKLAFWILLVLVLLPCLAGCGPAPAGPGPEPPASGQNQSFREETRLAEPTQRTESIPTSLPAATVTGVIDGDTAHMRLEGGRIEKVRFIGVDTPETHHPTIGEEPCGRQAAAFTARSLSGRKVWLELDAREENYRSLPN